MKVEGFSTKNKNVKNSEGKKTTQNHIWGLRWSGGNIDNIDNIQVSLSSIHGKMSDNIDIIDIINIPSSPYISIEDFLVQFPRNILHSRVEFQKKLGETYGEHSDQVYKNLIKDGWISEPKRGKLEVVK